MSKNNTKNNPLILLSHADVQQEKPRTNTSRE
jgi:hypothetical protein